MDWDSSIADEQVPILLFQQRGSICFHRRSSCFCRRRKRGILLGSHCYERIRVVSSSSEKKGGSRLSFSGSSGLLRTSNHRWSRTFCFPTSVASAIAWEEKKRVEGILVL
ncbi:hypothetical protein AAC387_Pa03g3034 [Persea americana]